MQVLAAAGIGSYLFLALLAVTVYVFLIRSQRHSARTSGRRFSLQPPGNGPGGHAYGQGASSAMAQWESQMREIAGEISARLDSKMAALEQRMCEADHAAARLEAATAAAERQIGRVSDSSWAPDAAPPARADSSSLPPMSQAEALRSAGTGDAGLHAGPRDDDPTSARLAADRRYEEIYALADYGLAPAEIAQRVGSPIGEVELILSLRGKR